MMLWQISTKNLRKGIEPAVTYEIVEFDFLGVNFLSAKPSGMIGDEIKETLKSKYEGAHKDSTFES